MRKGLLRLSRVLFLCAAQACAADDPAAALQHLRSAIGTLPLNPAGYYLSGRFTLKLAGDETTYQTTLLRQQGRWAADFRSADRTRDVRYVAWQSCWVSTPELTARVERPQLPYTAEYDFPGLWADLNAILLSGPGSPLFRIESEANDVYIRGKLRNGEEATFLVNRVQWLLRKVSITAHSGPRPAWTLPALLPNRSASLLMLPTEGQQHIEIWFSDFTDSGTCRYPQRTDFADAHGVSATFVVEGMDSRGLPESLYESPGQSPSAALLSCLKAANRPERSLYLDVAETAAFRRRIGAPAWNNWRRINAAVAAWSLAALPLSHLSPATATPAMLGLTLAVLAAGFVLIRVRSSRQFQRGGLRFLLVFAASFIGVMLVGIASIQLGSARGRSLAAMHAAIRYRVTGSAAYARLANRLLLEIPAEGVPATMTGLADCCRDYACAYDLVRPALSAQRCREIQGTLVAYATPLYSAVTGWRANTPDAPALASGLGLVGMALGCDSFLTAARGVVDKSLEHQFEGGLFRAGPGPGAVALDRLADFLFALKHAGVADYYARPPIREQVETLVQLLSPAGTLPLFGDTAPDDSVHSARFLLKAARNLPDPLRGQCVEAAAAYRERGRYLSRGTPKFLGRYLRPVWFFADEPSLLFQSDPALPAAPLAGSSAVLGNGRIAVFRSGTGPEALYLAVNAGRSVWTGTARDVLGFDLFGYSGLMLHGPGHPEPGRPGYAESFRTASANSVTFEDAGQEQADGAGVSLALVNQRLFDYVRVLADTAYDEGQVQRDAIMVRPEGATPGYFVLVDDIRTNNPATRVSWFLHGRGRLTRGVDQVARWVSSALSHPALPGRQVSVLAWTPGGGDFSSAPAGLYSREGPAEASEALIRRWTGPGRFATVLFPWREGVREPKLEGGPGLNIARVGDADWIGLGDATDRISLGRIHFRGGVRRGP